MWWNWKSSALAFCGIKFKNKSKKPQRREERKGYFLMPKTHEEIEYYANLVIGAAIEVHREIGPGYLEAVYEEALAYEFDLRHIAHERQAPIGVLYKQVLVGQSRLDFLVGECLVVELKAVDGFNPIHQAQVISY